MKSYLDRGLDWIMSHMIIMFIIATLFGSMTKNYFTKPENRLSFAQFIAGFFLSTIFCVFIIFIMMSFKRSSIEIGLACYFIGAIFPAFVKYLIENENKIFGVIVDQIISLLKYIIESVQSFIPNKKRGGNKSE